MMSAYVYDGSDPQYPLGKLAFQQNPGIPAPEGFIKVDTPIPDERMYWDEVNNVWYWHKDGLKQYALDKYSAAFYSPYVYNGFEINANSVPLATAYSIALRENPADMRKVLLHAQTGYYEEMTNAEFVGLMEAAFGSATIKAEACIHVIDGIEANLILNSEAVESEWATFVSSYAPRVKAPSLYQLAERVTALEST
jgi:hypothetical protein